MNQRRTVRLIAGCKINLFLHITGRRPDGYHELATLFYPLPEPFDQLDVTFLPDSVPARFTLHCQAQGLEGESNLVARAYRAFAQATGYAPALDVLLSKAIPTGAGLGGGSSDAAAMLRLLNENAGEQALAPAQLNALAASLGADVPFFLLNRPAVATSIGDVLTAVDVDLNGVIILLACPAVHVNTAWAYRAWDMALAQGQVVPSRPPSGLTGFELPLKRPVCPAAMELANDFEQVVLPAHPELAAIKLGLMRLGAAKAVMSGSGAAFFALFTDHAAAENAAAALRQQGTETYLVDPRRGVAKR